MSDAAELYQAVIDDHRRRPRHRGPLPTANRVAAAENPVCGDRCAIQLELRGDHIVAAAFTGAGCALSQASASLATVALHGLDRAQALERIARVETLVRDGVSAHGRSDHGDLAALSAAHAFPARHACALLAWRAAREALGGD